MYINHEREMKDNLKVKEAWNISKKYSKILMNHEDNNKHLSMCFAIHSQFLNELKDKKIPSTPTKNYIQCWNTLLHTLLRNDKISVQRSSIKLLHQTNIQKSYVLERQFN